jgi:type IV pilus assembly protein PilV
MKHRNSPFNRQSGASLIEVLVAFLLLSFGLLGLSGLQINALKNNQSALQRSQATMLAYFMMDAMRANKDAALAGDYNLGTPGTPPTLACDAPADTSLVTHDQAAWFTAMKSTLGNTNTTCGLVACDGNANCSVRVYWDDSRGVGGNSAQFVEIASQL